jgi:hypothetical protein
MADTVISNKAQSMAEVRIWDIDFSEDLHTGVSVLSATATHIPPSGVASVPTVGIIANGIVPVSLGPLAVTGVHTLLVSAVFSNGEKSELKILIPVNF